MESSPTSRIKEEVETINQAFQEDYNELGSRAKKLEEDLNALEIKYKEKLGPLITRLHQIKKDADKINNKKSSGVIYALWPFFAGFIVTFVVGWLFGLGKFVRWM